MGLGEFDLIGRYFLPLAGGRTEAGGFRNDGALLDVPAGMQLAVTSDTLSAGVHFLPDQSPETIAKKALRTNISDLIAMGAKPYCYQLCLSLKSVDEAWLAAFSCSLAEDQALYGIFLSGGDTTSTPGPLSISITAFGLVEKGRVLTRSGARDGDYIVLSGAVGDAWCGLEHLRGNLAGAQGCVSRYYVPEPKAALLAFLAEYAHAALDISDGLIADLGHMARESGLLAELEASHLSFSPPVTDLLARGAVRLEDIITGGDDYELVMAVKPEKFSAFKELAAKSGVFLQHIGVFRQGESGVRVLDEAGNALSFARRGWQHF